MFTIGYILLWAMNGCHGGILGGLVLPVMLIWSVPFILGGSLKDTFKW